MSVERGGRAKTKEELSAQLAALRRQVAELEKAEKERKRIETSLIQSEARYRNLFENMSSGVAVYEAVNGGEDFIFRDFNKGGEKIENVERENIIGKKVSKVFPGVKVFGLFEVFQRVWRTGKPEHYPVSLYQDDRLQGWRDNYVYKLPSGEIVAVYEDVTDRKEAEEKLKTSLEENELLLKEIHHRVKNNLAIISSLLNLQAGSFKDPTVINAFRDSQHRIRSMALVHEKLYKSGDLSKIDFAGYIRELGKGISQSHEFIGLGTSITVKAEAIWMGINTAIPCGMIINELLTNAFKYAFPAGREGEVAIRMQLIEGEKKCYELVVSDNGVGLPTGIDIQHHSSFGFQLVHLLIQQLGGEIQLDSKDGTAFTITFPAA
jgi:two-component sensor histidine kinase